MGRAIAVVVIRIVEAVFGTKKETCHCEDSREDYQD